MHTVGNPLTSRTLESFGVSDGNIIGRERKRKKKKTKNPQNMSLTATASGEVAQTLVTTTSQCGLDREARAA